MPPRLSFHRLLSTAAAAAAPEAASAPAVATPRPTDPALLLRLCTILYQHQNAPEAPLHRRLSALPLPSAPADLRDLFLQASARFPLSWCPVHRLLAHLTSRHGFDGMRRRDVSDDGSGGCYHAVVSWLCKEGRTWAAYMVFAEMVKRGVEVDGEVLRDLVYGLLARRKVREGYRVFHGVKEKDIVLYHGLMKGLVRIKRAREATEVFREMIAGGCEPNMHTYIMLLQGHLGKRRRKDRDPLVNFESIFVGGLVKAGKTLEATKFVEGKCGVEWMCRGLTITSSCTISQMRRGWLCLRKLEGG